MDGFDAKTLYMLLLVYVGHSTLDGAARSQLINFGDTNTNKADNATMDARYIATNLVLLKPMKQDPMFAWDEKQVAMLGNWNVFLKNPIHC